MRIDPRRSQEFTNYAVYALLAVLALFAYAIDVSGSNVIWLLLVVLIEIYAAPMVVAHERHHRNFTAIAVLNILVGWSFIGWVAALVWAFTDNTKQAA